MEKPSAQAIPPIPENTRYDEKHFHHYTAAMSFRRDEIAFAMVDIWDTGFGPNPLSHLGWEAEYNAGKSFCDKAGEIGMSKILPMMEACREAGLTVVHLPTRDIAVKHRQWEALATEEEKNPTTSTASKPRSPDWPPADWVKAWREEHTHLFRTKPWITDYYAHVRPNQNIPTPLRPVDGDLVVSSGDMMHRLMSERGIRILFYCGFATNMCLINKPGAILDMQGRGYMPIVIRDATAGTENAETLEGLWITHAMIDQIEMLWGYTITTSEFLSALDDGGDITVPCRYIRMYKPME